MLRGIYRNGRCQTSDRGRSHMPCGADIIIIHTYHTYNTLYTLESLYNICVVCEKSKREL